MALRNSILVLLVAITLCGACSGADAAGSVYRVGDSEGWIIQDYTEWSSSKEFHVSDSLLFSYNGHYHNVIEVTEDGYKSCDSRAPIAAYGSGSDTVPLNRPGHYYFICGAPGHCDAGQKIEVVVSLPTPDSPMTPISSPSPAPSGLSSPSTPPPVSSPSLAPSALSSPPTPPPVSSPSLAPSALSSPPTPPPVSSPSPAPSALSSPSTPHPQQRPPHSAAPTIDAPKLALAFVSVILFSKLMF